MARGLAPVHGEIHDRLRDHGGDDLGHGEVDVLALARAFARVQGGERGEGHDRADHEVGVEAAQPRRRPALVAREVGQARVGLHVRPPARGRAVRPRLAQRRGGHHDHARVDRAQGLVAEPHALHHARRVVLHDDVAAAHELPRQLQPALRGQVEAHALAAEVERVEDGPAVDAGHAVRARAQVLAVEIEAPARLHADHLRAQAPQPRGGVGARQNPAEIGHAHPLQRQPLAVPAAVCRGGGALRLRQRLVRVLAEQGRGPPHLPGRARPDGGAARLAQRPRARVLDVDEEAARRVLPRVQHLGHGVHGEAGHLARERHLVDLPLRALQQPLDRERLHHVGVGHAPHGRGEGLAHGPVGAAHHLHHRPPPVVQQEGGEGDVPVLAGHHPGEVGLLARDLRLLPVGDGRHGHARHGRHRLHGRHVHQLAAARGGAVEDGGERHRGRRPARQVVALRAAVHERREGLGVRDLVVGRLPPHAPGVEGGEGRAPVVAVRPVEAVRADAHRDQPRIARAQRFVVQPQLGVDGGREVGDEEVGARRQRAQPLAARIRARVRDGPALVRVQVEEARAAFAVGPVAGEGAVGAAAVARGRLHLEHVRAQVGEGLAAEGAGDALRVLDHAQPGERAPVVRHRLSRSSCAIRTAASSAGSATRCRAPGG